MSTIVVNVRLLSGDILPVSVNARKGAVKFTTARPALEKAVLEHLELKENDYHVNFIHDDDEERRAALRGDDRFQMSMELKIKIQEKIEKSRVYHDGDTVNVLVKKLNFAMLDD